MTPIALLRQCYLMIINTTTHTANDLNQNLKSCALDTGIATLETAICKMRARPSVVLDVENPR